MPVYLECVCRGCGAIFQAQRKAVNRGGGQFCEPACYNAHRKSAGRIAFEAGEKACSKCGETKPLDAFHVDRLKLDGRRNACKACDLAYAQTPKGKENAQRYNRSDKQKAAARRWYERGGREKRLSYATRPDRIEKTRMSVRAAALRRYHRIKNTPAYREAVTSEEYQTKRREYQQEWASRPDIRKRRSQQGVLKVARRRALKAQLLATLTQDEWEIALSWFDHRCAYCRREAKLQQDHFIPLTSGGTYTADNIMPACRSCNASKCNKMPDAWCEPEAYGRIMRYLWEVTMTGLDK